MNATPEPPGGPPATIRTRADSNRNSIADTVRTDRENGTYNSTTSAQTRLAYLDYAENANVPPLPSHSIRTEGSPTASAPQPDTAHYAPRPQTSSTPSSIIAFNARDALTNAILVDPVLGSDGLIHDRWSLLDSAEELAKSIEM